MNSFVSPGLARAWTRVTRAALLNDSVNRGKSAHSERTAFLVALQVRSLCTSWGRAGRAHSQTAPHGLPSRSEPWTRHRLLGPSVRAQHRAFEASSLPGHTLQAAVLAQPLLPQEAEAKVLQEGLSPLLPLVWTKESNESLLTNQWDESGLGGVGELAPLPPPLGPIVLGGGLEEPDQLTE